MTKYWRSIEELKDPVAFKKAEIKLELDANRAFAKDQSGSSRRDFLKTFGFTVTGAALLASCSKPVNKAIPFLIKPEEVTPGMANYYASSYFEGNELARAARHSSAFLHAEHERAHRGIIVFHGAGS